MEIDKFGIPTYDVDDIITAMYRGYFDLQSIKVSPEFPELNKFNAESVYDLPIYEEPTKTIQEFDSEYQSNWYIPHEYKQLNIIDHLISLCGSSEEEMIRLATELALFQKHNMIDLLRWVKYFVDTCRENRILWGVGRGSSVSSYTLFLLGLHKIDPLKYDLDIAEFFKELKHVNP